MKYKLGRWLIRLGATLCNLWWECEAEGERGYLLLTNYEVTGVRVERKHETIQ